MGLKQACDGFKSQRVLRIRETAPFASESPSLRDGTMLMTTSPAVICGHNASFSIEA